MNVDMFIQLWPVVKHEKEQQILKEKNYFFLEANYLWSSRPEILARRWKHCIASQNSPHPLYPLRSPWTEAAVVTAS